MTEAAFRPVRPFYGARSIELFPGVVLYVVNMLPVAQASGKQNAVTLPHAGETTSIAYCGRGLVHCRFSRRHNTTVHAGSMVALHSNSEQQASVTLENFRGVVVSCEARAYNEADGCLSRFGVTGVAMASLVAPKDSCCHLETGTAIAHIAAEIENMAREGDVEYCRLKAIELLLVALRASRQQGLLSADASMQARRLRIALRAQEVMMRDLTRALTISEVAQECGASATVLKEAFKEAFGIPLYSWYRLYRMQRAGDLLLERGGASIASIAAEVGYANPSKFSHAFTACMGMTPRLWRQRANPAET